MGKGWMITLGVRVGATVGTVAIAIGAVTVTTGVTFGVGVAVGGLMPEPLDGGSVGNGTGVGVATISTHCKLYVYRNESA